MSFTSLNPYIDSYICSLVYTHPGCFANNESNSNSFKNKLSSFPLKLIVYCFLSIINGVLYLSTCPFNNHILLKCYNKVVTGVANKI